jgi:hypothetical protein
MAVNDRPTVQFSNMLQNYSFMFQYRTKKRIVIMYVSYFHVYYCLHLTIGGPSGHERGRTGWRVQHAGTAAGRHRVCSRTSAVGLAVLRFLLGRIITVIRRLLVVESAGDGCRRRRTRARTVRIDTDRARSVRAARGRRSIVGRAALVLYIGRTAAGVGAHAEVRRQSV